MSHTTLIIIFLNLLHIYNGEDIMSCLNARERDTLRRATGLLFYIFHNYTVLYSLRYKINEYAVF